jgi:hypothetical protein
MRLARCLRLADARRRKAGTRKAERDDGPPQQNDKDQDTDDGDHAHLDHLKATVQRRLRQDVGRVSPADQPALIPHRSSNRIFSYCKYLDG